MAKNSNLNVAKTAKEDEFYTQLSDIEKEMRHYKQHFKDKTVLCNCDDPFESNFFRYFSMNFNKLGLKKLIATCYATSPMMGQQLSFFDVVGGDEENKNKPYKAVVTKVYDATGDGYIDMFDVAELFKSGENELTELEGDGDYASPECLALMDEADIVVTNPPFSQFRKYVATLIEHKKKFIIIGNQNEITYKDIFPLLMNNEMWLGNCSGDMAFRVPNSYKPRATRYWQDETGQKWRSMGNICWYTNLDIKKRHEELILVKRYDPEKYPKYINFDGIECKYVNDIPCDYAGNIGVTPGFMASYNPDQFEIVGNDNMLRLPMENYAEKGEYNPGGNVFYYKDPSPNAPYKYKAAYKRIVIRNKHPEKPKEVE